MEVEIKNGKLKINNFSNRKNRTGLNIDFSASEVPKIYTHLEKFYFSGETGNVMFRWSSTSQFVNAVNSGLIKLDGFHEYNSQKEINSEILKTLEAEEILKYGKTFDEMTFPEMLKFGLVDFYRV